MMERRHFIRLAAASALVPSVPLAAWAQRWPTRHVRFVDGFGGAMDTVSRIVGNRVSPRWGQPVIVETKAGAGGNLAAETVARAEPDGHTLLLASPSLAINRHLYQTLSYDSVADFAPVTLVCTIPVIMTVPESSPAKSVTEFIALAKARRVSYASTGNGGIPHLAAELFKRLAGIEMTHVPYRGVASVYNDLIAGRVDVMFTLLTGLQQIRAGRLRGLGVGAPARLGVAPELPTVAEAGLPGFDVSTWWAFFLPARTPGDIVAKIHADIVEALGDATVKDRIEQFGARVVGSSPAELAAHLKSEIDRWGQLIKQANIRIDE